MSFQSDSSSHTSSGKEKKRVDKDAAQATPAPLDAEALRDALIKIREEELPDGPEEKEQYFMSQVGLGEQLSTQGQTVACVLCCESILTR